MNLKNRLRHISQCNAGNKTFGRTKATCMAALAADGVVITHTHEFATYLKRKYGVFAKSYEVNMDGLRGPFFVDHTALEEILNKAANKIEALEAEIRALKGEEDPPEPEFPRSGAV